jgi:hypothetical protein
MQYSIDDLTFSKDDLQEITLNNLEVNTISSSHLYFITPNEQAFLLLRAGDLLTENFISEYTNKGMKSVYAFQVSSAVIIKKYSDSFDSLLSAKNELIRQQVAETIIWDFTQDFWINKNESLLSFVKVCFEKFYFLKIEDLVKLNEQSLILYSRGLLSSSFGVINCLMNRVVDPYFLKDVYNSILMMDYGLISEGPISYSIVKACEEERNRPGLGIKFLETQKRPEAEKKIFLNHPKQSAIFLEKNRDSFFNKEVIDIILCHHEKSDGSGFPFQIPYSSITDMETLLTFADNLVAFQEHKFFSGDSQIFLKKSLMELKENHRELPIDGVIAHFEEAIKWATEKVVA